MKNDILDTKIITKIQTTKQSKTSNSDISKSKDTPSLFDQMLKQTDKINLDETNVKKIVKNKQLEQSTSLLDNMIKNINKNSISNNNLKSIQNTKIDIKINTKVDSKLLNNEDIKENKEIKNDKKEIRKNIKTDNTIKIDNIDKNIKTDNTIKIDDIDKNIKTDNTIKINKLKNEIINNISTNVSKQNNGNITQSKLNTINSKDEILKTNNENIKTNKSTIIDNNLLKNDLNIETKTKTKTKIEISIIDNTYEDTDSINKNDFTNIKNDIIIENKVIDSNINLNIQNEIDNTLNKENKPKNLLDGLIMNAKSIHKNKVDSKNINFEEIKSNTSENKNTLKAETFISSQVNSKKIVSKIKIKESKDILTLDNKLNLTEKLNQSAKILELEPTKIEVEKNINKNVKYDNLINEKINNQNNLLNNAFINNISKHSNISIKENVVKNNTNKVNDIEIKSQTDAKEVEIEMILDKTTASIMTNKIVSARQNMTSFISDMTKQMYQNYKPPVTAFRINLNPSTLGSISIIMKSNKSENTMNVSMNMSQLSTLEALEQNKFSLHNALQKTFNNENSISLNFGMQENGNNSFKDNHQNNQNNNKKEHNNSNEIILQINDNEQDDLNQDYM